MSDVVVWFDGGCPLCRREIAFLRRLDRRRQITFLDISGGGGDDGPACPRPRGELLAQLHASENGRLLAGAAAFAAMWRAIPVLRPLGLLARWRPALWSLQRLYVGFLRVRPTLQRFARLMERRVVT